VSLLDSQTYQAGMEVRFARAERHSRRVRLMRRAVPIAVVVSLLVIALASIFNPFRLLAKLPINIDNLSVSGTKITMAAPHLTGFTPDQRAYDLRAQTATQDITDPIHVELQNLTSNVEMEDKSNVVMTGSSGLFDTKAQILELKDHIFLKSSTGYEARLTQATVNMAKGEVVSTQPVAVKLLNGGTLDAHGLHIVDNGALIVFEGGVSMLVVPDNTDTPATTQTTAQAAATPPPHATHATTGKKK
jgi:lipopolysaccharide export system protein LptC